MICIVAKAAMYTLSLFCTYAVVIALVELAFYGGTAISDIRRILIVVAALAGLFLLRGLARDD